MLFWVGLIVFGIPLYYAILQRKKHREKYQRELEDIQRRIAAKELDQKENSGD